MAAAESAKGEGSMKVHMNNDFFWWKGEQDDTNRLFFWVSIETNEDLMIGQAHVFKQNCVLVRPLRPALDRVCNIGPEFSYQPLARPLHSSS